MKPFSLYIPRFSSAITEADIEKAIALSLKKQPFYIKPKEYEEARKTLRSVKLLQAAQSEEVWAIYEKLCKTIDRQLEYAQNRIIRDHGGYILWEEEYAILESYTQGVKDILWGLLWRLGRKAKWYQVAATKEELDAHLTLLHNYRRTSRWEMPSWVIDYPEHFFPPVNFCPKK